MIKSIDRSGTASVTFILPVAVRATHVAVCGEWNDWSVSRHVMDRVGDVFSRTIVLQAGRTYRFRYLLDGHRWENDWDADAYVPNGLGSEDSVVDLTALATLIPTAPRPHPPRPHHPARPDHPARPNHPAERRTRGQAGRPAWAGHSGPQRPVTRGHRARTAGRAAGRHVLRHR
jgi:hypothetical protein